MSAADPGDAGPVVERPASRPDESILRGGLMGIALVTFATMGLAAAGALVALVVTLLF